MNILRSKDQLCITITKLCFAAVFFVNIICAVQFIVTPEEFISSYGLSGPEGQAVTRGFGITFLMWNATYPLFLINPVKYRILGVIILIQQVIGLVGEVFILTTLMPNQNTLAESITRFIIFDGVGLIVMMFGYWLLRKRVQ